MAECPLPPGSSCWAYIRDSGGEDQDIVTQRAAVLDYIKRNGLILKRMFVDEARPGSSTVGRDAFEDMLAMSKRKPPPAAALIVWSFSRFARNLLDAQFYKAQLRRNGVDIISITEDIPQGETAALVETIYDWSHEQYLKELSRNVKRTLHQLAKQGYSAGGFPPRGYAVKRIRIGTKRNGEPHYASVWVPDSRWAPKITEAFRMKADGATYAEIMAQTRVTKSGNSLAMMLRNRTYLGYRKCGKIETPNAHEPLVDEETWSRVQARLRARARKGKSWPAGSNPRHRMSPYLLSGLLRCERCGSAMIGSYDLLRSGTRWRFYVCGKRKREGRKGCPSGKLKASLIESAVMECFLDRVLTPDYIAVLQDAVSEKLNENASEIDQDIRNLESRLNKIHKGIYELLDLAERDGSEAARERLKEREVERDVAKAELRSLQAQKMDAEIQVSEALLTATLREMRSNLDAGDVRQKRAVLARFINRIEANKDEAKVFYSFPLATWFSDTCPQRGILLKVPLFCQVLDLAALRQL